MANSRRQQVSVLGNDASVKAQMKAEEYAMRRARMEDQENHALEQAASGYITDKEAGARMTRAKMHKLEAEQKDMGQQAAAAGANFLSVDQMIEEALETESKYAIVRLFRDTLGIKKFEMKVAAEEARRSHPDFVNPYSRVHGVVHQPLFDGVAGILVIANALLVGLQAQAGREQPEVYGYAEHVFLTVFLLEMICRLLSDGWIWIVRPLNAADALLIVGTGLLPGWIIPAIAMIMDFEFSNTELRIFQVLRIFRMVRLIRMVRQMPQFRILWMMIRGLLGSGRTLIWTYVMIFSALYMLSIFGVFVIGRSEKYSVYEEQALFKKVPEAMLTLFQVMTLDSWASVARPLCGTPDQALFVVPFFVFCIASVTFALQNLITAVIVDKAFNDAENDEEILAREKKESMVKDMEDLRELFKEIDLDESGTLSKEEYDLAISTNDRIREKFAILEIQDNELDAIWKLLETGGDGLVSIDEFADGLRAMQGDAKAKDSYTVVKRVQQLNRRMDKLSLKLLELQTRAEQLAAEASQAHKKMGALLIDVKKMMKLIDKCIPPGPAKKNQADLDEHCSNFPVKMEPRLKQVPQRVDEIPLHITDGAPPNLRRGSLLLSAVSGQAMSSMKNMMTAVTRKKPDRPQ